MKLSAASLVSSAKPLRALRWLTGCALLLAMNSTASACAVCMGSDNEQLANASNSVLWTLLALVGFIFVATGATAFYLWRKAMSHVPPDLALIHTIIPDAQKH